MVYRMIIHLNIELQIPVIYRADFGLRGFTPLKEICPKSCFPRNYLKLKYHRYDLQQNYFKHTKI